MGNDFDYDKTEPTDEQLSRIAVLAKSQLALEQEVAALEERLKAKNAELRAVREVDLPEAMSQAGCSAYKLEDGSAVTVKRDWAVSIQKDRQEKAFAWLEEQNLDSIIKRDLRVQFGRGEGSAADTLVAYLMQNYAGNQPTDKRGVHPQTLKATIKEQLARQVAVPTELFSLVPLRWAEVKTPQSGGGL